MLMDSLLNAAMECGLCQPLIALGAGINGVVGDDSEECMQPPDELGYFHLDEFLFDQLSA